MKYLFSVIIPVLIISACCRQGQIMKLQNDPDIQAVISDVYCWVNLMPGPDDPTIHLTAKVRTGDSESGFNLMADHIELISDSSKLILSKVNLEADAGSPHNNTYTLKATAVLKQRIISEDSYTAYFYFVSDSKMYKFETKNLQIERVY